MFAAVRAKRLLPVAAHAGVLQVALARPSRGGATMRSPPGLVCTQPGRIIARSPRGEGVPGAAHPRTPHGARAGERHPPPRA
eukprot:14887594-Alexandrium_andersonii.AAC.1